MSGPLFSTPYIAALCGGGFITGALLAHVFSGASQPSGTRYGSQWHAFQHYMGWWSGHIGHVRAINYGDHDREHVKVFGLVCETCGFVNVKRVLNNNGMDDIVQDEIGNRSTTGFTWTKI